MENNGKQILGRLAELGRTGLDAEGRRMRLAASDADREGRDLVAGWMREAGLRVVVDRIGNIFGIWETDENKAEAPVMTGSHIDSVIDAGRYDGCLGVISGLEALKTMKEAGIRTKHPLIVGVFTNEEGVRYSPDMMGSLVYAGGMAVEDALVACEQGPIMDAEGVSIGAVENLQGIHWQRITIEGAANHAGTTPTRMRKDAGLAAAKVNVFARELVTKSGGVATVGTIAFEPGAVNVIPSRVVFTLDLRNPDKAKLDSDDAAIGAYLKELEKSDGVRITSEHMTCFDPVPFDDGICRIIEKSAQNRGLSVRRMVSGAGQDAQMLARICPTAMIFVPSVNGISHNPRELTHDEDVINGANVLLDVLKELAEAE